MTDVLTEAALRAAFPGVVRWNRWHGEWKGHLSDGRQMRVMLFKYRDQTFLSVVAEIMDFPSTADGAAGRALAMASVLVDAVAPLAADPPDLCGECMCDPCRCGVGRACECCGGAMRSWRCLRR